jgi:hypothetical protein
MAMDEQLKEMRSTTSQTERGLQATIQLAEAASKQAEASIASSETAQSSLVAANRAWIAPISITLIEPLNESRQPGLNLLYRNTGREPALNFTGTGRTGSITTQDPFTEKGIWGENKLDISLCEKAELTAGGDQVVYPLANNTYRLQAFANQVNTARLLKAQEVLYVQACFAYDTMGFRRISVVCMYLAPDLSKPSEQWEFRYCPTGNHAD